MSAANPRRRTTGPLRVGVLGQGRSGYGIHCRWFEQSPRKYRIAAVADLLAERRREAETRFGCDSYREHGDLLARGDLDLVVNALPSHLHPPVTIEALKAGHHVVCEKPAAWNAAQLDRMIAAAGRSRRVLAPFQQSRYRALFLKTLEVAASPAAGTGRRCRSSRAATCSTRVPTSSTGPSACRASRSRTRCSAPWTGAIPPATPRTT